jgi:hypothetical protein
VRIHADPDPDPKHWTKYKPAESKHTCLPQAKPQESESVPLYFRQTYKSKKISTGGRFFLKMKVAFPDINHITKLNYFNLRRNVVNGEK